VYTFSLCALSIRLTIMRGLHRLVGRAKGDTLPRDLVYLYPTISALAAYISNPFLTLPALLQGPNAAKLLEDDLQWENILKSNVNNTVVKITSGSGEPPLILIHGVFVASNRHCSHLILMCQAGAED
jgi:hypothetical protein